MPTSINSRVVLIVRLICHEEEVYEELIFCKTSQYKSQLHFPLKITGLAQNLPISNNQTFYQEDFKPVRLFPSFNFHFHFDQIISKKVT